MTRLHAIVFDLDDTLYPENAFVKSGFRAVSRWAATALHIDAEQALHGLWRLFEQGARGNTFDLWLQQQRIDGTGLVDEMIDIYRHHRPRITTYPDVPSALEMWSQNCSLGLVTDGYLQVQQAKLSALRIAHFLDGIVFSDEFGRQNWKPSLRPFAEVAKQLNCQPHECVYVADNPLKDFVGPKALAMPTVRIRRAQGLYAQATPPTPKHQPDQEIEALAELPGVIERLALASSSPFRPSI